MLRLMSVFLLLLVIIRTGCGQNDDQTDQVNNDESDDDYDARGIGTMALNPCRSYCTQVYFKTPNKHRCIKNGHLHIRKDFLWTKRKYHC